MRQRPKSRINALLRPQRKQRRTIREENLGFFCDRATVDVFAMIFSPEKLFALGFACTPLAYESKNFTG
ncbi:MAG: hypothetical protein A3C06_01990 [Candidatus Taylorbacteria bacterium RIFCSPHIGHO2_02_FULL_46_13]|uniref:Uncharacterized protein n=1 Tax=Candidatus Taylorbacteria bacterium RIFCSPHIGHO2_02_FULL_46_13 TaxID=1802312 RepID=A0A1G2MQE1_9BACT|nr:MAG: hypothetical protein A3C06_01990 [Candidatus Taylorbacteria bacterium RIFCSPHIGHO2_02_FULL_46_13]